MLQATSTGGQATDLHAIDLYVSDLYVRNLHPGSLREQRRRKPLLFSDRRFKSLDRRYFFSDIKDWKYMMGITTICCGLDLEWFFFFVL